MARYCAPQAFTEGVANRLYELRMSKQLSLLKLATELDLPPSSVERHERGFYGHSLHTIALYAKFYGVTVDYIIHGLVQEAA